MKEKNTTLQGYEVILRKQFLYIDTLITKQVNLSKSSVVIVVSDPHPPTLLFVLFDGVGCHNPVWCLYLGRKVLVDRKLKK